MDDQNADKINNPNETPEVKGNAPIAVEEYIPVPDERDEPHEKPLMPDFAGAEIQSGKEREINNDFNKGVISILIRPDHMRVWAQEDNKKMESYTKMNDNSLGALMEFILEQRYSKNFLNEVINKLADTCPVPEGETNDEYKSRFQNWSHNVCHSFEHYGKGASVLDFHDINLIKRLVDIAVEGAVKNEHIGCCPRIIEGPIKYNLSQINSFDDLDHALEMKPESLKNPDFIGVLRPKYDGAAIAFCKCSTKKDFLQALIGLGDKASSLLKDISPDILKQLKEKTDSHKPSESREKMEQISALYVDVEGTLIKNGQLNNELLKSLKEFKEGHSDIPIYIFTDGDAVRLQEALSEMDSDLSVFKESKIRAKDDLRGKNILAIVDDTSPDSQALTTENYFTPEDFISAKGEGLRDTV